MLYIDCKVFFCKSYKREQRKSASGKILQKKFASLVVVNNETVTFYCNKSIQVATIINFVTIGISLIYVDVIKSSILSPIQH